MGRRMSLPPLFHVLNRKAGMVFSRLVFLFLLLFFIADCKAAAISSTATGGNWNATTSWTGGVVPVAGDDVTIAVNASITVTANAACNSITWAAGALTANRALTINSGFTLNVTTASGGTGIITMVTPGANFNRTISVAGTLNCTSLTMPNTGGNTQDCVLTIATTGIVNISGNLVMAGVFARNHVDMAGNAVINVGGNIGNAATPTAVGGGFTTPPTTSTISLNGTSVQTVYLFGGAAALGTLKVNNAAGVTNASTVTVTTAITIGDLAANSILKDSGFQITCTGTLNLNNNSFFKLGRTAATTTFPAFGTRNISAGTTVEYMAGVAQTVSTTPAYSNLTLSIASKTIAAGALTVGGNLIINTGATFLGSTNNPTVSLSGNFTNSGTFTSGTGLFTMNGSTNQSITSGTTLTFSGGLTIANTGTAVVTNTNAAISIPTTKIMTINNGSDYYAGANIISGAGSFILTAGGTLGIGNAGGIAASGATGNVQTTTRTFNTGSNYIYNGTVSQVTGTGLPATVNALTINNTGGAGTNIITLGANVAVTTDLTITDGVFNLGSFTANRATAGGTLTVADLGTLIIGGTNTLPANYSIHSIGLASTIEYAGTTTTVAALNSSQAYGNLIISGSGVTTTNNFSVSAVMTVTGSLIASGTSTVTMNAAGSSIANSGTLSFVNLTISATPTAQTQYNTGFTVSGALTVSGATNFSPTAGIITLSGVTGSISNAVGTLAFNNVTMSGTTISSTGNFSAAGTMLVTGTFAPAATSVISGAGTLSGTGTVQVTRIVATPSFAGQYTIANKSLAGLVVNYNGAGNQTVNAANYGSLIITTNGTRVVTFENGGTVGVSSVFTPTVTTTTYIVTGNTFDYNGSGAQTIAPFTYNNLVISNAGIKTIAAATFVTCLTFTINNAATIDVPSTTNSLTITQ